MKNFFQKVILCHLVVPFLLIILIFGMLLSGCKKKDQTYTPIPSPDPSPLVVTSKNPFHQAQQMQLLSENERIGNKSLHAYLLHQIGKNIHKGVNENGAGTAVAKGTITMFKTILHHSKEMIIEKNFDSIFNQLNLLVQMDADILTEINSLQTQLELSTVDIMAYIGGLAVAPYVTTINTAFATTSPQGLIYFAQTAKAIQLNVLPPTDTTILKDQSNVYINSIYVTHSPNIEDAIHQIHDNICPSQTTNASVLNQYTNYILLNPETNHNNTEVHDPANVMYSYQLVENYFLHLVNAQFQGLIIMANIYNEIDTSGYTFKTYYEGTFRQYILDEINLFQLMADKIATSLVDYRTKDEYLNHVGYLDAGLKYDSLFRNMSGRSRFITGMLREALGLSNNTFGMTIVVPEMYASNYQALPYNLPVMINNIQYQVAVDQFNGTDGIPGVYPYTAWNDKTHLGPDNTWYVYSLIIPYDSGSPVNTFNVEIANAPWIGTGFTEQGKILSGSLKTLYYNPRHPDPTQATTSPTDSNTIAFTYLACDWRFGILLSSMQNNNFQNLKNKWRNHESYDCGEQYSTANPVSQYAGACYYHQPQIYQIKYWDQLNWHSYCKPDINNPQDYFGYLNFYATKLSGQVNPLSKGYGFFFGYGVTTHLTIEKSLPGSTAVPDIFSNVIFQCYNTTTTRPPDHDMGYIFYGGTGSFGSGDNIPNNFFQVGDNNFNNNQTRNQFYKNPAQIHQNPDDMVSFAYEMYFLQCTECYEIDNFLPQFVGIAYTQIVYTGTYDIF